MLQLSGYFPFPVSVRFQLSMCVRVINGEDLEETKEVVVGWLTIRMSHYFTASRCFHEVGMFASA
jgi:hypothetical protein